MNESQKGYDLLVRGGNAANMAKAIRLNRESSMMS